MPSSDPVAESFHRPSFESGVREGIRQAKRAVSALWDDSYADPDRHLHCPNPWHKSAPSRAEQDCAECAPDGELPTTTTPVAIPGSDLRPGHILWVHVDKWLEVKKIRPEPGRDGMLRAEGVVHFTAFHPHHPGVTHAASSTVFFPRDMLAVER
jgi:hypothetical protein